MIQLTQADCIPLKKIKISSVNNSKELIKIITKEIKEFDNESTLKVCDIDMTLIQPNHPALFYPNIQKHNNLYNQYFKNLNNEEKDLVSTLCSLNVPQKKFSKNLLNVF